MRIRIANGLVAAFDGEPRLLPDACVDIADGLIVSIGSSGTADPDCRTIDASGCLVMPGLTNAHFHSTEVWAKGRSEGTDLESWFAHTFPNIDTLPDELIRIAGLLAAAEMLKCGVTTVVDHFRQIPATVRSVAAVAAAYQEAGINAGIAIMLRDRAIPKERDTADLRPFFTIDALRDVVTEAFESSHRPGDGIAVMLGPSAPHRCSDALLQAIGVWSEEFGLRIHTHVDEAPSQRKQAIDAYRCSTVRHLSDLGLLGPMLSLAHVTHVDADDIDLLARSGTFVVHNPVSNAKLGSGIAPLSELFQAGVPIALGTDGAASNDSQNQFEVLKFAALAQMLRNDRRVEPPKAVDIIDMATRNGGRLLGTHNGVLAPGARADVIVLDLQSPPLVPLNDVHRQLVYGGSALSAKHVVARGRHVVDDGVITTFDEAELYRQANALKRSIYP